jgi:hypothetical protein
MNASALPDPQVVSYDLLLSYGAISFLPIEHEVDHLRIPQEHPVLP